MLLALKIEKAASAKEFGKLLEAGKAKEMGSSLKPPERNGSCQYLDFSSVSPLRDSKLQKSKITMCVGVCVRVCVCVFKDKVLVVCYSSIKELIYMANYGSFLSPPLGCL